MRRSETSHHGNGSSFRYNLKTFAAPNVLLVEGPDEFQFFRFLRPRGDVQIHVYGGKDRLQLAMRTMRAVEGYDQIKRVAIVRDTDHDPRAALHSVLSQWASGLDESLPIAASDEWFRDSDGREWSVWLMPDPRTEGDLEALLWQAVAEGEHRKCIDSLITCLDSCNPVPFGSRTKAMFYSWLSTQAEPVKELHAALNPERGLFEPAQAAFSRFTELMDAL